VQTDRYTINSVLRAAQILESFSLEKRTYTNAELSRKLGVNKSSVTRLLCSLERAGFLERDDHTGAFKLTYKLYKIGSIYIKQTDLHKAAMPVLSELALSTKETAHLAVLDNFKVSFIDWVEAPQTIGLKSLTGVDLPPHCTASGKVLLAHLSDQRLGEFFRGPSLRAYTPNTITDKDALRQHLLEIRENGYAVDNAEFQEEAKGVACPLRDEGGQVSASISIAGPVYRMNRKRTMQRIVTSVRKAAEEISKRLGYY
jgi:DNA-binding IclR family transcriptional regulator